MATQPQDLVIAPGGLRHRRLIKNIAPGNAIGHRGQHRVELDSTGRTVRRLGRALKQRSKQPLFPRALRHPHPVAGTLGSGWIAYAEWLNDSGAPVSLYHAKWSVPAPPTTQSGQAVMYFNGIQNDRYILQPVLQWGKTALGGGDYWAVASWLASGPHAVAQSSPQLVRVEPGDVLEGVVTLTNGYPSGPFSYNCQFVGLPGTSLDIQNIDELTVCVATLEAYYVTRGTDYPAGGTTTAVTEIQIQSNDTDCTLNWLTTNAVIDCGQHADLISNASPGGQINLIS